MSPRATAGVVDGAVGTRALAHARALLRIDTSNPGATEEPAARYVADVLGCAGAAVEVLEPEPGRCSVVARVPGREPGLPALLVHGHLDVVPAGDDGWTHDPFGAVEADGFLWGRGAADMKGPLATALAAHEQLAAAAATGRPRSRRPIVFAYLADEEMGGGLGSRWLADHRPDLLAGVTEAIGELGGFAVPLPDGRRLYPVACGEHALTWLRVTLAGPGGHAALSDAPNPVVRAARLVDRIASLRLPDERPPAAHAELLASLARLGLGDAEHLLAGLGAFGTMARRAQRTRFVPTVVRGGESANVVPRTAHVVVDCRHPADGRGAVVAALEGLLEPGERCDEIARTPGARVPARRTLLAAARDALLRADPSAVVSPYALVAGSDLQNLSRLGIDGIGFLPLPLDDGSDYDYAAMAHVPDERIPVRSLAHGAEILLDFLERC